MGLPLRNFPLWLYDLAHFMSKAFPAWFIYLPGTPHSLCIVQGAQWQGESRVWRNQAGCSAPEFLPQLAHGQLHNEAMIPWKIEGLEENLGCKSTGGILSNFSKFWLYQPSPHLNANVFEWHCHGSATVCTGEGIPAVLLLCSFHTTERLMGPNASLILEDVGKTRGSQLVLWNLELEEGWSAAGICSQQGRLREPCSVFSSAPAALQWHVS